jgi:cytochrome c-type biogenesis protein CcmH/NrfG
MYNALTVYLFNIAKDYPAAAEAARHAIAQDPADINHQLWLASIFIAMKLPNEAAQQIALVKQLDTRGVRRKDIEELQAQLAGGR